MLTASETRQEPHRGTGSPDGLPGASARPGIREIWRRPLPYLRDVPLTRFLCRLMTTLGRSRVLDIRGLEHIVPEMDPFIFVSNHNQRLEMALLPTTLIYHRAGRQIHFLADWPTLLVPFAGLLLRRNGAIIVGRKRARGPFNLLKPLFSPSASAFESAREKLGSGASVGIFPEGTMNRHPRQLLRGQTGAAKLALHTGLPVVPAGIRFPGQDPEQPVPDGAPMAVEIGPPLEPPAAEATRPDILAFHARIMSEIARLSGKAWDPKAKRRRSHATDR